MNPGHYLLANGTKIYIEAIGKMNGKEVAVYYTGKVNKTGKLIHYACLLSDLKKKKLKSYIPEPEIEMMGT